MSRSAWVMVLVLSSLPAGCAGGPSGSTTGRPPNVLFLVVDDLNDWIGCMGGHPQSETPNIDRLAARGMLFTNAHCAAPLCNPSRASVMTGLYPATSGVHGNQQDWRKSPHVKGKSTLPQYFRERGYWTGACGKIFHANHGCECAALNGGHGGLRGFNHPESWTRRHPSKNQQLSKPAVMTGRNMNGLDIWHWDWGGIDVPDEETTDGRSVAWAVDQLGKNRAEPFFLAVGIYRPHGPWYVPQKYFDAFPRDSIRLPTVKADDLADIPDIAKGYARGPNSLHKRIVRNNLYTAAVQAYLANIHFADAMIGKVLDALDSGPHAENTIVCLWSDHGWHLGEKERWHKSTHWEEATRVPLIFSVPGLTDPGSKTARPASLVDLYPTLVELCGLEPNPDLDGVSLVPQLRDPKAPRKRPAITTRAGRDHSARSEHWRYIRYADGSEELYDHRNDPNEWKNLAGDASTDKVRKELAAWLPKQVNVIREPGDAHREPGFRPIVNEYDLTSWDGDRRYWSAKDGVITGRTTPIRPLDHHTYLIWRGAAVQDFELRLQFRIEGEGRANSGIQYRSRELKEKGKWILGGYQADFDQHGGGIGNLYEIEGRKGLAACGQKVELTAEGPKVTGSVGDTSQILAGFDPGKWNDYTIIARGNRLIHKVNGKVTVDVRDNHHGVRSLKGLIGFQLHRGKPMVAQFRNVRIKTFTPIRPR